MSSPAEARRAKGDLSGSHRRQPPGPGALLAARDTTIPDVVAPGLRVLFSGINPGLYSAATGYHFARPGNRFWPALHASGFTPRLLRPAEQRELLPLGLGITNVVARATARAAELTPAEIRDGGAALAAKVARLRPHWVAVVGITVYRTAFGRPGARPAARRRRWPVPRSGCCPTPAGSTPRTRSTGSRRSSRVFGRPPADRPAPDPVRPEADGCWSVRNVSGVIKGRPATRWPLSDGHKPRESSDDIHAGRTGHR